jgi:CheY-like chemotaxis protein
MGALVLNDRPVVLVVDDEVPIRTLLRQTLLEEGYEVLEAGDGPAALELAATNAIEVVLLDIRLPGMDGSAVAQALRDSPGDTPRIVILTAARYSDELVDGADAYLSKPFDLDELLQIVEDQSALAQA